MEEGGEGWGVGDKGEGEKRVRREGRIEEREEGRRKEGEKGGRGRRGGEAEEQCILAREGLRREKREGGGSGRGRRGGEEEKVF